MAWLLLIVIIFLLWATARWYLSGPDMSRYATSRQPPVRARPSEERHAVVASLDEMVTAGQGSWIGKLQRLRAMMDEFGARTAFDGEIRPVKADGISAEWVLAPGADSTRRVLYIHGGAFTMGSPRSHRGITAELARRTGLAVLAIDYRLMPEHRRMAGIEDCRSAYRWLLDHGPDGPGEAARVWVAGDSAGGNLTLSLITWVRDAGLRAPDAAVALSPFTDATLGSPSLRAHVATDPMLGPLFGKLARVPRTLLLWTAWLQTRINPRDPVVSPVYGDLSRLPPVLVQASEVEMLRDDARRWVNRARAAGSPAQLQVWDHMVHVWQLFHPELAEGRAALDEVGQFLASSEHRGASPGAAPAAGG